MMIIKLMGLCLISLFVNEAALSSGSYGGSNSSSTTRTEATPSYQEKKPTYIDYSVKIECKDKNEIPQMCENVVGATKKFFCKKKGKRYLNFQIIRLCKDRSKDKVKKNRPGKKIKSQNF